MLHKNIKVGEGQLGDGELLIPEGMRTETANLSDLVDAVFPSIATRFNDASWVGKRAIISPSNMEVAEVNSAVLQRLPGDEVLLKSIDTTAQCARCTVGFSCSQNSPGDATKLPSIRHRFGGIICIATGE